MRYEIECTAGCEILRHGERGAWEQVCYVVDTEWDHEVVREFRGSWNLAHNGGARACRHMNEREAE